MEWKIRKILVSAGFEEIDDDEYSNGAATVYINSNVSVGIFGDAQYCEIIIPELEVYDSNGKEVLTSILKSLRLWNSR